MTIDRRAVLKGMGSAALVGAGLPAMIALAEETIEEIRDLKPGQFTWHPERSPEGPVAIIVSLTDQLVHIYRNGIRIAVSTCSSGKPGYATPTGVFTILEKAKVHHSSTYNEASMPNTERLTWSGVALHAGGLPGYPSSHGCVHLPLDFSAKLFTVTHIGTPVIVAAGSSAPASVVHPGLVLANYAESAFEQSVQSLAGKSHPADWPEDSGEAVTSVIVSRADSEIQILQDGAIVASGKATIKDPATPLGSHVFILEGTDDAQKGLSWTAVAYDHNKAGPLAAPDAEVIKRIGGPPDVIAAMKARMHPGMVLILTDLPAQPDSKTGEDFVVLSDGEA